MDWKILALEFVRVTEAAALAAAHWMGQGKRHEADQAATEAMRSVLAGIDVDGTVVIGEGERDEAPMLYIGERVGSGRGDPVDIAVDPLEGTNLVATGSPNALAVIAASERGGLLHAPDTYMEKLIVGPPAADKVSMDYPIGANLQILADSLRRHVSDLTIVILDRPRHKGLIEEVRSASARIKLISDGDVSAAIAACVSGTGVHAVFGTGGAPEGVLAAAAIQCLGGAIYGRFRPRDDAEAERARGMGIDLARVYRTEDLASGRQIIFAASGVTDGDLLRGVRFFGGGARTASLVMNFADATLRFVDTVHVHERTTIGQLRLS